MVNFMVVGIILGLSAGFALGSLQFNKVKVYKILDKNLTITIICL